MSENPSKKPLSKAFKALVSTSAFIVTSQSITAKELKLNVKRKKANIKMSKSFKTLIAASVFAVASSGVLAYQSELSEDSTRVTLFTGGSTTAVIPHSSHSNHSSRGWR